MAAPDSFFPEVVSLVKSWMPWRSEPSNVSRDFWMPDDSCRVCYECDVQFTLLFNRKHHCRLCGRVFCARCTENSVPAPAVDRVERERVRVYNFCYKQHQQGIASTHENGIMIANLDLSTSPLESSFTSFKSCGTGNSCNSNLKSIPCSPGPYQRLQHNSGVSPCQSSLMGTSTEQLSKYTSWTTNDFVPDTDGSSPNHFGISVTRSDDEDVDFGMYQSASKNYPQVNDYYDSADFCGMSNIEESHKVDTDGENAKYLSQSPLLHSFDSQGLDGIPQLEKKEYEPNMGDECTSSLYSAGVVNLESVDFEKNALLWLPPEPEDEEDESESVFDGNDDGDAAEGCGTLRASSSCGSRESHSRDRSGEENTKVMKNVVDGHFRALVAQLLQVENLPVSQDGENESWLEIITQLSWEAATLLKPDMSKGGGMDPGGYVKVKCIASGRPSDSMVVKGVVCKKNLAHRRMPSKMDNPRFMIFGGALEYQRVSNLLSSFDTLLQQEMDHLKMAVAKIEAHHPDVLLVEKSVSRYAQEYLLEKDISLVLNIKRSLLERIARCTGAQIVPSIDHLSSQKFGYCESFHVERFLEDLGSAGQGGKKLGKTLMYFEGCPKPLGCTILLRGANGDELKKVKHVIQYGIFAAYHLALETSFLADEGATLPELPLQSPITVALLDKPSSNISTYRIDADGTSSGPPHKSEPLRANSVPVPDFESAIKSRLPCLLSSRSSLPARLTSSSTNSTDLHDAASGNGVFFQIGNNENELESKDSSEVVETSAIKSDSDIVSNQLTANIMRSSETMGHSVLSNSQNDPSIKQLASSDIPLMHQDGPTHATDSLTVHDEFPPSPADHQSILVSLSTRCVWKGTVCERAHRFRIKYYGSFDKPLGRFLRDHLFDQTYHCQSCEMPSEAHVHCYTHRQGTLTISVKRLPEIFLPGEKEGKIWMWHRCLRCPRINGFPPATQRIVMSDAAWGLSFGKFLELSFSNHAAASRVASCGHSLHRDCLRFYGFGKMVACFRYASIDVHSVYLPPSKLDFVFKKQDWIQEETNEVVDRAELLFSEVLNALRQITEKRFGSGSVTSGILTAESRQKIVELEGMLQKEKLEFEELLQKTLTREPKVGRPDIDILEINRLRRQLLFQSYLWDHRLVYASSLDKKSFHDGLDKNNIQTSLSSSILTKEKPMTTNGEYNPVYISSYREGGARLLLPVGDNDTVIPVYDDEPASLIAYALASSDYKLQTNDEDMATQSFTDSVIMHPDDDYLSETHTSLGSNEDPRVSFGDEGPLGKVKYTVMCYFAKRFEALRKLCCPSELAFIRSLSRCKKWGAQGGKSNVFFAKTLDDRFIIKQVTKTELESFIKFAPAYFKYVSGSIITGSPTCLAKILGIYQFTSKHVKGGKETKMDVLVMENLLFGRNVTRVYDLKGSSRSRYNPDSSGSNKVLLDQNLIEAMPTSPIFVGNKAKRLLERAVWNDTAFLASVDVMDYSLLVGVDEEKHELVLGIIDYVRQYTWDKHLETWVKASGILGGPKNASPTVISPMQCKKRFRKAMTTYFLMVPDQWHPTSLVPSSSQSDFDESANGGTSVE